MNHQHNHEIAHHNHLHPYDLVGFGEHKFTDLDFNRLEDDSAFEKFGGILDEDHDSFEKHFSDFMHDAHGNSHVKSYFVSTTQNGDEKPVTKKFFSNRNTKIGENGQRIGEIQEMYYNNATKKRVIAQERTLNGQGRKVVKSKIGHEPENVKRIHQGFTEENALEFDNQWNDVTQKIGYTTTFKHPDPHMLASHAHNSTN